MFKFALKNMAIKKVKILLIIISIIISASVAILAYNIAEQVDDGFKSTASYYDTIIGPSGSSTQLAMNTMFFTDKPLGTISYEYVEQLEKDNRVNVVVPFTMGDSYNGAKIVGTTPLFLDGKNYDGSMFNEKFEAVIGYEVAQKYGLSIGDKLITSHGLSEGGHAHENNPLVVVGILNRTKTAYDNVIFTHIETVWSTHDHGDEEHTDEHEEPIEENVESSDSGHGSIHETPETDHGSTEEKEEHHGEICAILLRCKTPGYVSAIKNEYGKNGELLVINPSEVLREVLDNVDMTTDIVYALCVIILIMNIFIISVITLLNMYDSKKEIALMRLIGISMSKINLLYIIQNAIIGFAATILSLACSRLCILGISGYVSSMGIVLDAMQIYPFEFVIMGIVFVISVLPTIIYTMKMSRQDGLSD